MSLLTNRPDLIPQKRQKKNNLKIFLYCLSALAITIIVLAAVYRFYAFPYRVTGNGMSPFLRPGELVWIHWRKGSFLRNDVVGVYPPQSGEKSRDGVFYLLRIIALPGEKISIQNKAVQVNGRPFNIPGAGRSTVSPVSGEYTTRDNLPEIFLPPNQYFLLGDNREASMDSRFFGPVDAGKIFGGVKK